MDSSDNWIGTEEIPLRFAEQGRVLRVGKTRVPIDTVIYHFKQGLRPEEIVSSFDVLKLADVYLVIGYYLRHQQEIDEYLEKREREGEEIRREITSRPEYIERRARFLERAKAMGLIGDDDPRLNRARQANEKSGGAHQ